MSAITAKASRKMKKYAVLTREPRCFLGSFDFSWEQRKVGEVSESYSGGTPSVGVKEYYGGQIPFIRSAEINSEITELFLTEEGLKNSSARLVAVGDILYALYGATSGEVGRARLKGAINQAILAIKPHTDYDSEYLAQWLRKSKHSIIETYLQGGQGNLSGTIVKELSVDFPSLKEQKAIGDFFRQLDNLITLHQRKCVFLFGFFQAFISMIFTASTFSWEQRKFDEVFDCTVPNNTLSRAELSYDEGTVLNVHYGDVLIKYGSVLDVQKDDIPRIPHRCREDFNGALLQDGDVIIADTAEDETTGKACEIGNLQGSAIVSGLHTMVCRPRNRMALGYLGYYLNSNAYHHQLLPLMQGIKVLSLSRSNIQKTSVSYPIAVKEQQLIAYYFSQLDNLITLHQRECISFTARAGRLILTANKKRNTSSWEQRKLGDIADIVGGGTPSTGNQSYWDGDIDWYAPAEIADQIYANSSQKKITGLGYENSSAKMLPPGTVLFTSRAGIGKTAILTRKGCTNQGFQSIVPHRGELDSYFIFSRTEELKRYGELVGAGSTFVEVSGKQMAVMELMMPPTMREQQTIGGFFQQLDHLITLHQRKPFIMKWRTSDANRNQTNRLVL